MNETRSLSEYINCKGVIIYSFKLGTIQAS